MSWSFSFKGKKERVIEAVKAWKPTFPPPEPEAQQIEQTRALLVGECERNPSEFVQVSASGSYYKNSTDGSGNSNVQASASTVNNPLNDFLL